MGCYRFTHLWGDTAVNKLALFFCMTLLVLDYQEVWSSEKCKADIQIRLTGKVTEDALGATRDMGVFEVTNQSKSAISVPGWRWKGRFFVDFPDLRLEAGPDAAGWRELLPWWIADGSAPPDKLVVAPGSKAVFHAPLLTAKSPDVRSTDQIRLSLKLSDRSCVVSEPFMNPYHR